jgi:hypothetical protein
MSSSEKRTIKINPELFKVSEKNTSRKKRTTDSPQIKIKAQKPVRNKTLRRNVMRMIREKQKDEFNKLVSSNEKSKLPRKDNSNDLFKSDFEKSLQYYENLKEKEKETETENEKQKRHSHNTTFKRERNDNAYISSLPLANPFIENTVSNELPDVFNEILPLDAATIIPMKINNNLIRLPPPPQYGCLKGGNLPTYRKFIRETHNIRDEKSTTESNNTPNNSINISNENNKESLENTQKSESILSIAKKDLAEKKQKLQKKLNKEKTDKPKLKYLKQKKIYNRTYRVGKSKVYPKIGVLISNKTVRQRISTNALHLKQTPMPEVKKFLVKKGFIKVGSIAPNDVLRQMYECAHLMCGEIENHNPENLLYNYFNDKE